MGSPFAATVERPNLHMSRCWRRQVSFERQGLVCCAGTVKQKGHHPEASVGGADGGCAARRIAARLIAKHSSAVPVKLGETLSKLVKLSACEPKPGEPAVVEAAARRDALQGLGRLCGAASAHGASDLVTSATEHLLRCGFVSLRDR